MRIELRSHTENSPSGNPAENFQPYIDIFPVDGVSRPIGGVLILPGGGYIGRSYHEGDPIARRFNELGYHAFVLQYRVFPYTYPAPQRDLVRAVKLLRSMAGKLKLDKLAVLGFSAGAHLAASGTMLAEKFNEPEADFAESFSGKADAMILCYPVISLTDDFAHRGSGINLFGKNTPDEIIGQLNMQNLVDNTTPPTFIWHTANDAGVPVRNSTVFAENMWRAGKNCELHIFPDGPHGVGLGLGMDDVKQWPVLAGKFLHCSAGFTKA